MGGRKKAPLREGEAMKDPERFVALATILAPMVVLAGGGIVWEQETPRYGLVVMLLGALWYYWGRKADREQRRQRRFGEEKAKEQAGVDE